MRALLRACAVLVASLGVASASQEGQVARLEWLPAPKGIVAFIRGYAHDMAGYVDSGDAQLRVRYVDLNGDKKPEFFVEAIGRVCGAANCPAWLLKGDGDTYAVLAEFSAQQTLRVLKSKTMGYADLLVFRHMSAFEQLETLYKFAGPGYVSQRCVYVSLEYADADGEFRVHKKPKRTACK